MQADLDHTEEGRGVYDAERRVPLHSFIRTFSTLLPPFQSYSSPFRLASVCSAGIASVSLLTERHAVQTRSIRRLRTRVMG